jgi:hypothetical protein
MMEIIQNPKSQIPNPKTQGGWDFWDLHFGISTLGFGFWDLGFGI